MTYTIVLSLHFIGTLFIIVIVEDSTVMGVTEQLSAITANEGDNGHRGEGPVEEGEELHC